MPLTRSILETIPPTEDAEIVGVLDITFLEIQMNGVLLGQEVESIQRFRLSLGDGWNVGGSGVVVIACERPPVVLNPDLFAMTIICWDVVQ
jgi:hypothetical protein